MNSRRSHLTLLVCGIVLLASVMLAARSIWVVHEVVVFSRNGATLTLGQLRVPADSLRLKAQDGVAGSGIVMLRRTGAEPTAIPSSSEEVALRTIRAGDELCSASSCNLMKEDTILAVVNDPAHVWWTTRSATLRAWNAPLSSTVTLTSDRDDELLIALPDGSRSVLAKITLGVNYVNTASLAHFSLRKCAFAVGFCILSVLLAFYVMTHLETARERFRRVPLFSLALGLQLAVQYLAVFPGMFNTDTVIATVEAGGFTDWYSAAYMNWAYLTSPLTPLLIQLPLVVMYFVVTVYLASEVAQLPKSRAWLMLLFLVQLLSPAVFVTLFAQQRIFVAALLFYAGTIIAFLGLIRRGAPGATGWGLLVAASLMRIEYFLYLLAFWVLSIFRRPKVRVTSADLRILFSAIGTILLVNVILPSFGSDTQGNRTHYNMTILLDTLRPYVRCNDEGEKLRATLDTIGGFDSYCEMTPEIFFWSKMRNIDRAKENAAYRALRSELLTRMASNPAPAIKRFGERLGDIAGQPAWQIYNRYQPGPDAALNVHVTVAEAHSLTRYYSWQRGLTGAATAFYGTLSKWLNVLVWLGVICIMVPLASRGKEIIVLNSVTILLATLCIAMSPTSNWSYLIAVPFWGLLAFPLNALLGRYPSPRSGKWRL